MDVSETMPQTDKVLCPARVPSSLIVSCLQADQLLRLLGNALAALNSKKTSDPDADLLKNAFKFISDTKDPGSSTLDQSTSSLSFAQDLKNSLSPKAEHVAKAISVRFTICCPVVTCADSEAAAGDLQLSERATSDFEPAKRRAIRS